MNKYILINAFLICALNINFLYPMLREWKYKPINEIMNPQKAKQREDLCCEDDVFQHVMQQNNVNTRPVTSREQNWTCHQYTISKILGYGISFTIIDEDFQTLYTYFKQVESPQENDLAFYVDQIRQLLHSGTVLKSLRIESKWGDIPYICDHDFFTAPDVYGNKIVFFRLKSKYNNPQGKQEAACQLYYDFTTAKHSSRSTHGGAEKPTTYEQFILNKSSQAKMDCA